MSVRLEWIEARNTRATLHEREDILEDGQPVSEEFALALHTTVFEGSRVELLEMLVQAMKAVTAASSSGSPKYEMLVQAMRAVQGGTDE